MTPDHKPVDGATLADCPFCEATEDASSGPLDFDSQEGSRPFRVCCWACGCEGPPKATRAEAISASNRRPSAGKVEEDMRRLIALARDNLAILEIADAYGLYEPGSLGDADVKDTRDTIRATLRDITGDDRSDYEIACGVPLSSPQDTPNG